MNRYVRLAWMTVYAFVAVGAASPTYAGRQALLDGLNGQYSNNGQLWTTETNFDATHTQGVVAPFTLNFGADSTNAFTFDPHGQVTFGNGNYIAPLLATTPWVADPDFSHMRWNQGFVDPLALGAPVLNPEYDFDTRLPAYRISWEFVCAVTCDNNAPSFTFQMIFVGRGGGDFDLDFNYVTSSNLPGNYVAGFKLGASSDTFSPPSNGIGPDYCFRGGQEVCGTVAAIPEPETWAMVVGGMTLLGLRARRRRPVAAPTT